MAHSLMTHTLIDSCLANSPFPCGRTLKVIRMRPCIVSTIQEGYLGSRNIICWFQTTLIHLFHPLSLHQRDQNVHTRSQNSPK